MNLSLIRRLGLALALATVAAQALADDSIAQLRAENARLRAQLQQLQQSCPVAAAASADAPASKAVAAAPVASAAPALSPASPAAPAPVAAAAPAPVPAPVPASVAVQVQPTPAAPSPAALASVAVPAGYKLVPLSTPTYIDPLAPPYDHTGCSRGPFQGPPPAKWNDAENWQGMRRGLGMAEVNDLLGKEHFDSSGHDRIEWDYGKCGDEVAGRVQFIDGQVANWQVPAL